MAKQVGKLVRSQSAGAIRSPERRCTRRPCLSAPWSNQCPNLVQAIELHRTRPRSSSGTRTERSDSKGSGSTRSSTPNPARKGLASSAPLPKTSVFCIDDSQHDDPWSPGKGKVKPLPRILKVMGYDQEFEEQLQSSAVGLSLSLERLRRFADEEDLEPAALSELELELLEGTTKLRFVNNTIERMISVHACHVTREDGRLLVQVGAWKRGRGLRVCMQLPGGKLPAAAAERASKATLSGRVRSELSWILPGHTLHVVSSSCDVSVRHSARYRMPTSYAKRVTVAELYKKGEDSSADEPGHYVLNLTADPDFHNDLAEDHNLEMLAFVKAQTEITLFSWWPTDLWEMRETSLVKLHITEWCRGFIKQLDETTEALHLLQTRGAVREERDARLGHWETADLNKPPKGWGDSVLDSLGVHSLLSQGLSS